MVPDISLKLVLGLVVDTASEPVAALVVALMGRVHPWIDDWDLWKQSNCPKKRDVT